MFCVVDVAPAAAAAATRSAVQQVSTRSGIVDNYKVCWLEGEVKELQLKLRELRKQINSLYNEILDLKEENSQLRKHPTHVYVYPHFPSPRF